MRFLECIVGANRPYDQQHNICKVESRYYGLMQHASLKSKAKNTQSIISDVMVAVLKNWPLTINKSVLLSFVSFPVWWSFASFWHVGSMVNIVCWCKDLWICWNAHRQRLVNLQICGWNWKNQTHEDRVKVLHSTAQPPHSLQQDCPSLLETSSVPSAQDCPRRSGRNCQCLYTLVCQKKKKTCQPQTLENLSSILYYDHRMKILVVAWWQWR